MRSTRPGDHDPDACAGAESGKLGDFIGAKPLKTFLDKGLTMGETVGFTIPGTQQEAGNLIEYQGRKGLKGFIDNDLTMADFDISGPAAEYWGVKPLKPFLPKDFFAAENLKRLGRISGRKGANVAATIASFGMLVTVNGRLGEISGQLSQIAHLLQR